MNNDSSLLSHQDRNYINQDIMVLVDDSAQPFQEFLGTEHIPSSASSQSEFPNVFLLPGTDNIVRDYNDNHPNKVSYIGRNDSSQNIILGSTANDIANTDSVKSTQIVNAVGMDNQQLILTENDLEALASCLFTQQNVGGMTQNQTNAIELDESLCRQPQGDIVSNVGLSVNCTTSIPMKKKSAPVDETKTRGKKKKGVRTESTRKEELSKMFDNLDSDALPKDIPLPLPTFCNCQVQEETQSENVEQSLRKYNKVIFLHHVGSVILNGVEFISFKRSNTVFISREQMECEQMFAKKKSYVHHVMDVSCRKFLSMVDYLVEDELDYLKQKKIISKRSSRKMALSIGLACWILDFVNDRKTTPYAKILGHVCEKPKNILMISKSQFKSSKMDNDYNSPLALTTILITNFDKEIDNEFLVIEIGRVLVNVTCLAAFQVHQDNKCYVNCHQVLTLLQVVSPKEFNDIVKKRNCQLVPMPEKISDHFQALDSSLPDGFFYSQWIEVNEVSRICCFWMGRHGDDVANGSFLADLAHDKVVCIFKKQAKGLNYPVTYPQSALKKNIMENNSHSLLQSSACAASSETPMEKDLLTLAAHEILDDMYAENFADSELGMNVAEKTNPQMLQRIQDGKAIEKVVNSTNQPYAKSGNQACKRRLNQSYMSQVNKASKNEISPNVKKQKVSDNSVEHALKETCSISNLQNFEIPQKAFEAEKILQNLQPVAGSTSTFETSKDVSEETTIDGHETNSIELLPGTECLGFQQTSPKTSSAKGHIAVVTNEGREVLECVPLFSLDNLIKRDLNIAPRVNLNSPLKLQNTKLESPILKHIHAAEKASTLTAKNLHAEVSKCENVKLSESDVDTICLESFHETFGPFVNKNVENTTKTLNQLVLEDMPSASDTGFIHLNSSKEISMSMNSDKEFSVPDNKTLFDKLLSFPQFTLNGSDSTMGSCYPLNVEATLANELQGSTSTELVHSENNNKTSSLSMKTISAILQAQSLLKELVFSNNQIQTATGRSKMHVKLKGEVRELFRKSGSENIQKMKHQLLKLIYRLVMNIQHVNKLQNEPTSLVTPPNSGVHQPELHPKSFTRSCNKQQKVCEGNFKNAHQSPLPKINCPKQTDTIKTSSPSSKSKHVPYTHSYIPLKVSDLKVVNSDVKETHYSEPPITSVSDTPDFQQRPFCSESNLDIIPNLSMHNIMTLDSSKLTSLTKPQAENSDQNAQETFSQQSLLNVDTPSKLSLIPSLTKTLTPAPILKNMCPEISTAKVIQALTSESSDLKASTFTGERSNSTVSAFLNKWPNSTAFAFSTEQPGITAFSTVSAFKPSVSTDSAFTSKSLISTDSAFTSKSLVSTDSAFSNKSSSSAVSEFSNKSSSSAVSEFSNKSSSPAVSEFLVPSSPSKSSNDSSSTFTIIPQNSIPSAFGNHLDSSSTSPGAVNNAIIALSQITPHQANQIIQSSKDSSSTTPSEESRFSNNTTSALSCNIVPYQANQSIKNSATLKDGSSTSPNVESRSSNDSTTTMLYRAVPHQPEQCNLESRSANDSITAPLHQSNESNLNSTVSTEGSTTTPYMESTIPVDVVASDQCDRITGNESVHQKSKKPGVLSDFAKKHSLLTQILSHPPKNIITTENVPALTNALTISSQNHINKKRTSKKPRRFSPPLTPSKKIQKKKNPDNRSVPDKQCVSASKKSSAKEPRVEYIYVTPKSVSKSDTFTFEKNIPCKKSYKKKFKISELLEQKDKGREQTKKTNFKYVAYAEARLV